MLTPGPSVGGAMAFTSRLLSRSRKLVGQSYGTSIIIRHEHGIARFFVKEAVMATHPTVKGDEISSPTSRRRMNCSYSIPSALPWKSKNSCLGHKDHIHRFSVVSDASDELLMKEDFFHFITSAFAKQEGPNHCWLNRSGKNELLKKDGPYLVLVGVFLGDATPNCRREHIIMFERVKSLQQRCPSLQVFCFQSGCPVPATRSMIVKTIIEDYITFPILLSEKFIESSPSGDLGDKAILGGS